MSNDIQPKSDAKYDDDEKMLKAKLDRIRQRILDMRLQLPRPAKEDKAEDVVTELHEDTEQKIDQVINNLHIALYDLLKAIES